MGSVDIGDRRVLLECTIRSVILRLAHLPSAFGPNLLPPEAEETRNAIAGDEEPDYVYARIQEAAGNDQTHTLFGCSAGLDRAAEEALSRSGQTPERMASVGLVT